MKRWTRAQGLEDQVTYLQLLRRDALLKNFGFQPQVLRVVHTAPFEGSHVVGPEPKVLQQREHNIRHADRMSGSSVTFQKMTKVATTSQVTKKTPKVKTQQARTSVFNRLGFTSQPTIQRTITQDTQSFRAESVQGGHWCPNVYHRRKSSGATQASAAGRCWHDTGGGLPGRLCPSATKSCRATNTVEEGVGLNFRHWPQLTHHSIVFHTRDSRQDLQKAVDALLSKGAIESVLNETSLGFYSQRCQRRQGICVPSSICLHWIVIWWCYTSKWKHRCLFEQPSGSKNGPYP